MKLEKEIAALNAVLRAALVQAGLAPTDFRLDGLAVSFAVEGVGDADPTQANRFVADASPAAPDEAFDVHIFHLGRGSEFTPGEFTKAGGRHKTQSERAVVTLIGYTNRPGLADLVKHHLAKENQVELRLLEIAGDLINEKYLFLEKQPNADFNPRQLFALTYSVQLKPYLGGDACPVFDMAKPAV